MDHAPRAGRARSARARLALGVVLAMAALPSCKAGPPPHPAVREEKTKAGVRFFEVFADGADDSSPLVVAIHGRGGNPESFAQRLSDTALRAEWAFPQAFEPFARGWSWFGRWESDEQEAEEVGAAERKLWPAIVEVAHGRKILVTGFSQGGFLSYAIAARHPDEVLYAFPISGELPPGLWPTADARTAPVHALHGDADEMVDVGRARATTDSFRKGGHVAELVEFPGVGHTISPEMRADLLTHLRASYDGAPVR